jgi:hypothetical protein
MNLQTLLAYLIGDRTAIRAVAGCRAALWIGAALVLAAGLARNYDRRDLAHEGWYVLAPLAASTVLASVLFAVCGSACGRASRIPDGRGRINPFWGSSG